MNLCRFFITRPVAAVVLMLIMALFGFLHMQEMPIREYPNIEVPTISVSTSYIGASSNVIETKITQTIENAVAGIEGLDNIRSTSKEGRSRVHLEFDIDRDLDAAANDVRDRINRVLNRLPEDADTPIVRKYDSSGMPIMMLSITSSKMSNIELSDYASRYIVDRFSVLDGVASVDLMGQHEKSMRIWLDRNEMASRGVAVSDVLNALKSENVEYPAGRLESTDKEFPITLSRNYNSPDDFRSIIVARDEKGEPIRMSDIARINIEAKNQRSSFKSNKENLIAFGISKQSTANTLTIAKNARALVDELRNTLPEGMEIKILRDDSSFIESSIKEVFISMIIAAILVFAIVFAFIGSVTAALIPTITVPLSILGACIVMNLMNHSINILTLLAMVLAIGIVVDDAILVLENIQRHIDEGKHPLLAAVQGSNQVVFAVISTTVVLLSVFLPIGMLPGKTGRLFTEFSVAMSSAVCCSSVVALFLTPMLCSKFLRASHEHPLNEKVNRALLHYREVYYRILDNLTARKWSIGGVFLLIAGITIGVSYYLPGEYEPVEDRNEITVKINANEGIGYYAMSGYMDEVLNEIYPLLDEKIARNIIAVIPGFGNGDGAVNSGMVMIDLVGSSEREMSAADIADQLRKKLSKISSVSSRPILPMGIGSKGSQALQFVLGGYEYEELIKWRDIIFHEAKSYPGVYDIDCDHKETTPKLQINVDRQRAGDLNIPASTIGAALEVLLGSKQVTTFVDRGQEYDVILQASKQDRTDWRDISNIYVRSNDNHLASLDNIIHIKEVGEPSSLGRQNRSRSITISSNISNGYSLSDVISFFEKVVKEKLPEYAQVYYRGQSKDYKESEGGMIFVFSLAVIVSFLVLAAQFESFLSPLVIMLSVPLGVFGAVVMLWMCGYTMNVYTQIGIIMLIGLSAKHGILIVEFANQLRDEGMEFTQAVLEAAKLRLRPIMMTGISTVAGAMPLVLAVGEGAVSRRHLGVVQVFGGLSGVLLTLIVIPIGYLIICNKHKSPKHIERHLQTLELQ